MSLSKNINSSLVLVQSRKTRPLITERLLMGHKNQIKQKFLQKGIVISPCQTEYFCVLHSSKACSIPVVSMYYQVEKSVDPEQIALSEEDKTWFSRTRIKIYMSHNL